MNFDSNGKPLADGALVRLLRAPPELLEGLPLVDCKAIRWAANEILMRMVGQDEYGNVELEFADPEGVRHWIFVRPTDVALAA
ncbi:hypothetical protein [uncultured Variovorax sp.]|uniref:hypothetical protein n=1 Tax=uncultured Variovorax sp. TaxID=114708 RepID=UPI0025DB3B05|nr:hypothetical protein [uncultured Variovorax sp.]